MQMFKIFRFIAFGNDGREVAREVDPANFIGDAVVGIELGNTGEFPRSEPRLFGEFLSGSFIVGRMFFHASTRELDALATGEIPVLVHKEHRSAGKDRNDHATYDE